MLPQLDQAPLFIELAIAYATPVNLLVVPSDFIAVGLCTCHW